MKGRYCIELSKNNEGRGRDLLHGTNLGSNEFVSDGKIDNHGE
jgi:hypothetical protein